MSRKIPESTRFPEPPQNIEGSEYLRRLHRELSVWARDLARQINELSESRIDAHYNSLSATPTLSTILSIADVIRDNSPTEDGLEGAKYVRLGWIALEDGTASAGSVVELRALTGN